MKPIHTEDNIQYTLRDVANGKSVRKASLDWAVPRTTLHDRIFGRLLTKESHAHLQRLAPVQEQRLTD